MNAGVDNLLGPQHQRRSVRFYIVVVNLLFLLLLFPSISILFWNKVSQVQNEQLATHSESMQDLLEARGSSLLRSMSLSINQAIASYDFSFINNLVQLVTNDDPELEYCILMDMNGVAVAHSEASLVGKKLSTAQDQKVINTLLPHFPQQFQSGMPIPIRYLNDNRSRLASNSLEIIAPTYSGDSLWGCIRCAYSLASFQSQIQLMEKNWRKGRDQFAVYFIATVLLFLTLSVLLSLFYSRHLLFAINRLDSGVQEISQGNLQSRLSEEGLFCLEFMSLADAINAMAKQLEENHRQLDTYNQSLENQVTARTQELENANRELEAFSYSVSHDLRAPLRSIDGFSKVLLEDYYDCLEENGRHALERVRANAQQMGVLIDSLLLLSRTMRNTLTYAEVDLSAMALSIIAEHREEDPERTVHVHVEAGMHAHVDENLIRIVLENLLSNAWKYTSKREESSIEFATTETDSERVYYVRDNGAGFDPRYRDKLFQAFERLHRKDEFEGTGIGLATVSRIVRRHGGRIWAEGGVDKGATFYFTLSK